MNRLLATLSLLLLTFGSSSSFAYEYLWSCGPTWGTVPVDYWINSAGSADIPIGTVESIMQSSFDAWGAPCCSEFGGSYRGRTSATAYNNQGNIVMSFVENQWNPGWGSVDEVIGVTFTQVSSGCRMIDAPILFNGVRFQFTTAGGGTDLQSIATHEIGHLLGLNHSSIQDATMYYAYQGGVSSRTLHQDDRNAVCDLYFEAGCSCSSTSQCGPGEVCLGGVCRLPPCSNDSDCDDGLSCLANGDCGIPPCASNADCGENYKCEASRCVSSCAVCRTCQTTADCGGNAQCIDLGEGMRCHVFCNQNAASVDLQCPGDSTCWGYPDGNGGSVPICGSPTANTTGLCTTGTELNPVSYVCVDDGIFDECNSGAQCLAEERCVRTTLGRRCQLPADPCADVTCGDGLVCENGSCRRLDISNNVPGNTTGPTNNSTIPTLNNSPGNNTTVTPTTGEEDLIIVVLAQPTDEDTGCCATTSPKRTPEALLVLLGAFIWTRRRR